MIKIPRAEHGSTLLEILVAATILVIGFVGVVGILKIGTSLTFHNKARMSALALATERMEYLRSLSYDSLGVQGGIPAGELSPQETLSLNGISFTRRTTILYVDATQDGTGADDENGITADYKQARVTVSWTQGNKEHEISLLSYFAPPSVESVAGGGTLTLSVFDASVSPVSHARVHIVNEHTAPHIDTIVYTNDSGTVSLPGAPAATGYQITITKEGFSTDKTYGATTENPNPNPGHLTVSTSTVTSKDFFIDRLSSWDFYTAERVKSDDWSDSFTTSDNLATTTHTTVTGGALSLTTGADGYSASGTAETITISPSLLHHWDTLSATTTLPAGTSLFVQLIAPDGNPVPDTDMPGNAAGFIAFPVDIHSLSTSTYPSLRLRAVLQSTATDTTPLLHTWKLDYHIGPTPVPDFPLSVHGQKTIGDNGGTPLYKFATTTHTDAEATLSLSQMEWDTYTFTETSPHWTIASACPPAPFAVAPATSGTTTLLLAPQQAASLRSIVRGADNTPLSGAHVTLTRGAWSQTQTTDACGQALIFAPVTANDYTLTITRTGYHTATENNVSVSAESVYTTVLQSD